MLTAIGICVGRVMFSCKKKAHISSRAAAVALCLLFLSCASCENSSFKQGKLLNADETQEKSKLNFQRIKSEGVLRVIIENSSTGYFIYKGKPKGYDYELLQQYADHLGVRLQFIVTKEMAKGFDKLHSGEGDILAYNLTVTNERRKLIAFTNYLNLVRLVLVQRKPDNWAKMKPHEVEEALLRNPIDLIDKKIVVRKSSSHVTRLKNLSDEIGGEIIIAPAASDQTTEMLIQQVAGGKIAYTIAEENIALLNATYFSKLDVSTPLSLPQQIAWGVHKDNSELLASLNSWIDSVKKKPDFYVIYNRYFKSPKTYGYMANSRFSSIKGSAISPFDEEIKKQALSLGWDWKLLAALVYKESMFDPEARSWAGAVGLMQMVPETGVAYGAEDLTDPKQNLNAGVKYLKWLNKLWKNRVADEEERIRFVLASYNVGQGHVIDAVKLTEKYHGDPTKWSHVSQFLLKKTEPNYFNDPVAKFGYCRCEETVSYVQDVCLLYEQYAQMIKT